MTITARLTRPRTSNWDLPVVRRRWQNDHAAFASWANQSFEHYVLNAEERMHDNQIVRVTALKFDASLSMINPL